MEPGHTVVVESQEKFALPAHIGAFGFPPAAVSKFGILMTNPGHIDPGYCGHVSFTLVNMGRQPFWLKKGGAIGTFLFFRLPCPVGRSYLDRGKRGSPVDGETLSRLSKDFLDIDRRASEAATRIVRSPVNLGAIAAVVVAVAAAWATNYNAVSNLREDLSTLGSEYRSENVGQRLSKLEATGSLTVLQDELNALKERLRILEADSSKAKGKEAK